MCFDKNYLLLWRWWNFAYVPQPHGKTHIWKYIYMIIIRPKKKNCYVALTRPKLKNWVGRSGFFFFFFFFFFTYRERVEFSNIFFKVSKWGKLGRNAVKTHTVRAEIFAVVLFSRISRVKPSRKFPLQFMSIYSNDNISKIAKLTTRELPHLAKTAKITVRENNGVYSIQVMQVLF